ncbi:Uncharacterized protein OBRU01_06653, partial [Operophtera brumata]
NLGRATLYSLWIAAGKVQQETRCGETIPPCFSRGLQCSEVCIVSGDKYPSQGEAKAREGKFVLPRAPEEIKTVGTPDPHGLRGAEQGVWTPSPHVPRRAEQGVWTPGPHVPRRAEQGVWTPGPHVPRRVEQGVWTPGPTSPRRVEQRVWTPGPHAPSEKTYNFNEIFTQNEYNFASYNLKVFGFVQFSMESIINVQKDIQRSIERALINFKKSPKERITNEYIEAKIDNLEKDWTLFRSNNAKLYETYKSGDLDDSSYVTNDVYERLGNDIKAKYLVQTTIQSRTDPKFKLEVQAYVLAHITSYLPETDIEKLDWLDVDTMELADPQFATPRKIDMLLGADVYSQVLKQGLKKGSSGKLVAQSTSLGWILSGIVTPANSTHNKISVMHIACKENKDELVNRFREIEEETSTKRLFTKEEQQCETFYKRTTKRGETDIVKRYHQVKEDEEDVSYQHIVWRNEPEHEIQDYELMTVAAGTDSAPFLPVRAMHQVAYDDREESAFKVLNYFDMDDLMTSCSTIEEGVHLYRQMVGLLDKGGGKLKIWSSNNQEHLKQINKYENTDKNKTEQKQIKQIMEQTGENYRTNKDKIEFMEQNKIELN